MTYASNAYDYYDADSHIMELPNFLTAFADPKIKDQIPEVSYSASVVTDDEVALIMKQGGQHTAEHKQFAIDQGDEILRTGPKEIQGLGAFNGDDRKVALDMLGFKRQLVFATHSLVKSFHPSENLPSDVRYGATRAHNRAMADFCSKDDRLMGVGAVPLADPERATEELEFALKLGLKAIWLPHQALGGMAPGHVDFHPFWALLEESGTPFVLHVGGAPLQVNKAWSNTGAAKSKDWLGGGENLRSLDITILHQAPELFLSSLIIHGVLERFPKLKGAAVELGAGWVPEFVNRMDWVARIWGRADKNLANFKRRPSEQINEQIAFTPFVHEDVGRLIEHSNPDLYLFSSDYPHIEGGKDPIGRFEGTLQNQSEAAKKKFYTDNFLRIFPEARV
jgi:predicted TIM-barrel fold metal-dependent hydrolase